MIYMMCYDVCDPSRLKKTAKVLESYGIRVQKSFFQAEISEKYLKEIKEKLDDILIYTEDSFYVYPLCKKCLDQVISIGTGDIIVITDFEII